VGVTRRERKQIHLHYARIEASCEILARVSRGLSDGDILNIGLNAIHAGSADADPAKWRVTQAMLELEMEKARAAMVEHEGNAMWEKRVIGFGVREKSLADVRRPQYDRTMMLAAIPGTDALPGQVRCTGGGRDFPAVTRGLILTCSTSPRTDGHASSSAMCKEAALQA